MPDLTAETLAMRDRIPKAWRNAYRETPQARLLALFHAATQDYHTGGDDGQ